MNNYHYIIAGLPELMPDFHAEGFSYKNLELAAGWWTGWISGQIHLICPDISTGP